MTLKETANQIYGLTIAGYINDVKFTKKEFQNYMDHFFKHIGVKKHIIQIALPDGKWLCKITEYAEGQYDYYLPDTREQENRLFAELGIKAA